MNASAIAPFNLEEAASILAQAARRNDAVTFLGGGTELGFGYPAERTDLVVETRNLIRIVDYAPADMVVEVEAGCTLAALQATLAPQGQRLAIDPPCADRATVGGVLATNAFGPLRTRFGSLRDLIVGVSLIRADGTRVRGGGRVVKNVAGFDLPKIAVGSLGTLGMIATATFRLHPIPEVSSLFVIEGCEGRTLRTLVRALTGAQLEPAAFCAVRFENGYDAYVLFEGFAAGVAEQRDRTFAIAKELGLRFPREREAAELRDLGDRSRSYGNLRLRIAVPPSELDRLETGALAPLAAALPGARILAYPSLGIAFVNAAIDECGEAARSVLGARTLLESLGGHLVTLDAPADFHAQVDVYGTLPPSFALMRELKDRFDPQRRLNAGRFLGRL